jgi:hypothetical protein
MKEKLRPYWRWFLRNWFIVLVLIAGVRASMTPGRFIKGMIWSDAEGYYLYLPALFINGGFEDLAVRSEVQFPLFEDTNKRFTKYTYGVALMELPFFLLAHLIASIMGEADGYSYPYIIGLQLSGLFYGLLGLWFMKKLLEEHFEAVVVLLTVFGFFLGTNLYHYVLQHPAMSHVYSFFLFGLLVRLTPEFYKSPTWRMFGLMGVLLGLIVLIRPTNVIIGAYILLFNIKTMPDLNQRLQFWSRHLQKVPLAALGSFLIFLPQLAYWKYLSGNWVLYSYGEEGFNWLHPRIDMVLFNIKNGWLLFSPMAGLAVVGGLLGSWKNHYNIAPITLIWLLTLYITASWWCWWFGGAFGHRNFVEYYMILAIPFAWLFQQVFDSSSRALKVFMVVLWMALLYYSYMLAVYYHGAHYNWESWKLVVEYMLRFKFWGAFHQ